MTSSPVRIGIAGLDHWYWAFSFAEAVAASPEAELVAIADGDAEHALYAAKRFGAGRVAAEARELIEDRAIDLIASFANLRDNPAICIAAARAGKHIVSVKPLARTLPEATEMLTAVREAGVIFLPTESVNRLTAQSQQIKRSIAGGQLGQIIAATYNQHAGLPQGWMGESDPGWFTDPQLTCGGGWIDHSIYHIDMLRWLLEDEVGRIGGRAGRLKYPDLPVEDYGSATIQFQRGLSATVEVTWIAPPYGGRTSWTIIGTAGAVSYDSMTGHFSVVGDFPPFKGWLQTTPRAPSDAGLSHLLACIRGEATPIATVEDAWRNLAACLAFYEAAAAGSPVTPPTLPHVK